MTEASGAQDGTRERLTQELESANRAICAADARREDDGFVWIDETRLTADFVDYYQRLTSLCFAYGVA